MKSYRSSLGFVVVAPIIVIMLFIVPTFIVNRIWAGLAVNIMVFLFILHMFLTTRYMISGGTLKIVCGFLYRNEIPLHSISSIKPSRNPISSPAFSLDRLELHYNGTETVLISPKNKASFLRDLNEANGSIVIEN